MNNLKDYTDIIKHINYVNFLIKKYGTKIDSNIYYELIYAKRSLGIASSDIDDKNLQKDCDAIIQSIDMLLGQADLESIVKSDLIDIRKLDDKKYDKDKTVFMGNTALVSIEKSKSEALKMYFISNIPKFCVCILLFVFFLCKVSSIISFNNKDFELVYKVFLELVRYVGIFVSFVLLGNTLVSACSLLASDNMQLPDKFVDDEIKECYESSEDLALNRLDDVNRIQRNFDILDYYKHESEELRALSERVNDASTFEDKIDVAVDIELAMDKLGLSKENYKTFTL